VIAAVGQLFVDQLRGTMTTGSTASKFDAAVVLLVIGLGVLGVLSNLLRMRPAPDKRRVRQSLVYTIVGTVMGGFLSAAARATGQR
jgi:hypothetical protein